MKDTKEYNYYCITLFGVSISFCSFSQEYFVSEKDLDLWIKKLISLRNKGENIETELLDNLALLSRDKVNRTEYFYSTPFSCRIKEKPVFRKVSKGEGDYKYDYSNMFDCVYNFFFSGYDLEFIYMKKDKYYERGVKYSLKDVYYTSDYGKGVHRNYFKDHSDCECVIYLSEDKRVLNTSSYIMDKTFDSEEDLIKDMENPELDFESFFRQLINE